MLNISNNKKFFICNVSKIQKRHKVSFNYELKQKGKRLILWK